MSNYRRINWRCSRPPGKHGKQPRSRSLPRVRRIRINDTKPDAGPTTPKKNGGGRQPLAKHLKRERIVHDLTDSDKHCEACAQDLQPIGEESSERYEYIPAQLMVIEDVCKKYAQGYANDRAAAK